MHTLKHMNTYTLTHLHIYTFTLTNMSAQLLWVLEHLAAVTSQPPETPNERNFQAQYSETINSALQRLRSPATYASPHNVWEPFKEVTVVAYSTKKEGYVCFNSTLHSLEHILLLLTFQLYQTHYKKP